MPALEDITYDRDATIAAVTGYYEFLTTMYLSESKVAYPPAGGWPSIVNADPVLLQSLGKSDEVISLLAHLPYIRSQCDDSNDAEATPGCVFADWSELMQSWDPTKGADLRLFTEGMELGPMSPPHVIGLTCGNDEYGSHLILDTELGIVHWEECPPEVENEDLREGVDYEPEEDVSEEEADWRYGAPAWTIPDLFEILQHQFKVLHWIPISHATVRAAGDPGHEESDEAAMAAMLQGIYRQHGWPNLATYRKAECLEAVRKAMAERYPDSACVRA
jgi:hypothetical protein